MSANNNLNAFYKRLVASVWLFPALLTIGLALLTVFEINGSSIGMYQKIFYGEVQDDNLIANDPKSIRSDEWLVTTQKAITQKYVDFNTDNPNIGIGEDVTLLADVPHRDWSILFKPHNIGFLFMPFDNAFALRWWMLSYLLVLSAYFFIITLLPGRRLLAALLSLAFLMSPFLQWWYISSAFGSIYYALFGGVIFVKLIKSETRRQRLLWSAALVYIATSFVLILYPPFQVPIALTMLAFCVGYLLDHYKELGKNVLKEIALYLSAIVGLTILIVGVFLLQRLDIIHTIQNTAYPGNRTVTSGGYSLGHISLSNLSPIFQNKDRADTYSQPGIGAQNQSEHSNFILIAPFLLLPIGYLLYKRLRKNRAPPQWTIVFAVIIGLVFAAWLFIPGLDVLGKVTLLNQVHPNRLLIGFGLLNFILIILFVQLYSSTKYQSRVQSNLIYSLIIIVFYLLLNFYTMTQLPDFIGYKSAVILSFPFALIVFLFLQKRFVTGAAILLLFCVVSTYQINPIYKGTTTITESPISQTIRHLGKESDKKWVTDFFVLENFAAMNGEPSLTGVYAYPQLGLWDQLGLTREQAVYNRYAHVFFVFDRQGGIVNPPSFATKSGDLFSVLIEPCDDFFKNNNVGFIITPLEFLDREAPCAQKVEMVTYPNAIFHVYKLTF